MRDRYRTLRLIGGGLSLVVALSLAALLAWALAHDLALWVLGRHVKAEVVDRWVVRLGEQTEGELQFDYYLEYRFSTSSGEVITKTTTVGVNEWAMGGDGQGRIDVVYLPFYPEANRLDDSRYVPLLACSYLPAILIATAVFVASWQLLGPAVRPRRVASASDSERRGWWWKRRR